MKLHDLLGPNNRAFYKRLGRITLPILIQQLISTALYMVDTVMIGQLGEVSLAGVGAANQLTFLLEICLFGVTSGGSILCAQYWGKRDQVGIHATLGLCLLLGAAMSGLFLLAAQLFGRELVGLYVDEAAALSEGMRYIRIASFGYLIKAISSAYGIVHKATERPTLPMYTGLAGILTNVALNYCLIYGNLGFPALGVEGAAIATVIGVSLDAALLLVITYCRHTPAAGPPGALFRLRREDFAHYAALTLPIFLSDLVWAVGINLYNFLYGRMGTEAFAAITIYSTIEKLAFVAFFALGMGLSVVIGNTIGEGRLEDAYPSARNGLIATALVGVITGAGLFTLGPLSLAFFNVSAGVKAITADMLRVMAFVVPINALNHTAIIGILRAGGDTRWAMALDVGPMWALGIPATAIAGLFLGLPPQTAFLCSMTADCARLVLSLRRVRSRKWINDVTIRH